MDNIELSESSYYNNFLWKNSQSNIKEKELKEDISKNSSKEEYISKYLQTNLELTPEQAAGITTHIIAESGGNASAINKDEVQGKNSAVKASEAGTGLIQWTGSRAIDLKNYVKTHGGKNDLNTQLDFLVFEIKNTFKNFLENLRKTQSASEAADLTYVSFVAGTKRYSDYNADQVYRDANNLSLRYQAKKKEMGHKVRDSRMERRESANKFIYAKQGGIFPSRTNQLYNILNKLQNDSRS